MLILLDIKSVFSDLKWIDYSVDKKIFNGEWCNVVIWYCV